MILGGCLGACWGRLGVRLGVRLGTSWGVLGAFSLVCVAVLEVLDGLDGLLTSFESMLAGSMFGHVAIEFALCGLPKCCSREVPTMCFDGVARVSRAAAQLAFFVAVALDVYQVHAIWNVFIDSLFLNALPVPMLVTGLNFNSREMASVVSSLSLSYESDGYEPEP